MSACLGVNGNDIDDLVVHVGDTSELSRVGAVRLGKNLEGRNMPFACANKAANA